MKALLEVHILQNFAPSNLNRDDTGSPKDAYFGGVRRGRVSSQSFKRAMRMYFKEQNLVPKEHQGMRTKRFLETLTQRLTDAGREEEEAKLAVKNTLTAMGTQKQFKFDSKRPELTEYLFSLGEKEISNLVAIIQGNWDNLTSKKPDTKDLKKTLEKTLDGGQAVDIALFGRMLANLPEANQDAACQVAHTISTHKIEYDEDFYTAVDDLKPDDNAGADMIGTIEFNSACYYRYAALDLAGLKKNLLGDEQITLNGVEAFLKACIYALPTGKQNTFAAHQLPSFIGFTVRRDASPRSLANAFERPVRSSSEGWVTPSAESLIAEWNKLNAVFGQDGVSAVVNLTEAKLAGGLQNTEVETVDDLLTRTLAEAGDALQSLPE